MDPNKIVKEIVAQIKTHRYSVVEKIIPINLKDKVIGLLENYNYYAGWYNANGTDVLIYVLC